MKDAYLRNGCTTYGSVRENIPLVETFCHRGDGGFGIIFDTGTHEFVQSIDGDTLTVSYGKGSLSFTANKITVGKCKVEFTPRTKNTVIARGECTPLRV